MISRRAPRPSRPAEQLRQFSLTNGAGVSCHAAHNSTNTVYRSKNFVTNLDGSVSIRKPLMLRSQFNSTVTRVIPTNIDEVCVAIGVFDGVEGLALLDKQLNMLEFQVSWKDMLGNLRSVLKDSKILPVTELDARDCKFTHSASSLLLSNCTLKVSTETILGTVVTPPAGSWMWDIFDYTENGAGMEGTWYVKNGVLYATSGSWALMEGTAVNAKYVFDNTSPLNLNKLDFTTKYGIVSYPGVKTYAHLQVQFKNVEDVPMFDTSLYATQLPFGNASNDTDLQTVVRCVQVYYDTDFHRWCVKIISPVENTYAVSNYGVDHPVNTMLDNPFSATDEYLGSLPYVYAIREYVPTETTANGIVPITPPTYTVETPHEYRKCTVGRMPLNVSPDSWAFSFERYQNRAVIYGIASSIHKTYDVFKGVQCVLDIDFKFDLHLEFEPYRSSEPKTSGDTPMYKVSTLTLNTNTHSVATVHTKPSNFDDALKEALGKKDFSVYVKGPAIAVGLSLDVSFGNLEGTPVGVKICDIRTPGEKMPSKTVSKGEFSVDYPSDVYCEETTHDDAFKLDPDTVFTGHFADLMRDLVLKASPEFLKNAFKIEATAEFGKVPVHTDANYPLFRPFDVQYSWIESVVFESEELDKSVENLTVAQLTESVASKRFRAAVPSAPSASFKILKAFISLPQPRSKDLLLNKLYGSWRHTYDGVTWIDSLAVLGVESDLDVSEPSQKPIVNLDELVESNETVEIPKIKYRCTRLRSLSKHFDNVSGRGDCLIVDARKHPDVANAVAYKFNLYTRPEEGSPVLCGSQLYYRTEGAETTYEEFDLGNAALGDMLYRNHRIFFYGHPSFKSNVFCTYPDEFLAPTKNVLDFVTIPSERVTSLTPWRNSLIVSTTSAMYRADQVSDGFLTKAVCPFAGVPIRDAKCCVTTLNGVIFKSANKVYILYPNVYSDDDSVLNVTELSTSIEHYLEDDTYDTSFAFSTPSEYVLMLTFPWGTRCLRYSYDSRTWNLHEYPVVFDFANVKSMSDIRLYGKLSGSSQICEYIFDANFSDVPFKLDNTAELLPYGDVVVPPNSAILPDLSTSCGYDFDALCAMVSERALNGTASDVVRPISFELDTGQKSDTINTTKQFVETKLLVATLSEEDAFPVTLTVHIDGDPHITTRDLSTDSAFSKATNVAGTLGPALFGSSQNSDTFNTIRQLIVRYSGKGKSIRHILTGKSYRNFKLYETHVRYKDLNVKR